MDRTRQVWRNSAWRLSVLFLFSTAMPGCGIVGPCSPGPTDLMPGGNSNDNTANDNTGNDNTGNDNVGNDNTGGNTNDNTNPTPTGCDAATCTNCDASTCLTITRAEHFPNGSLNITGTSNCSQDLAVDWYKADKTYLETFFIFGDGRSSTVGQFDAAAAASLGGYRVRRNSEPQCLCTNCSLTATP